MFAQNAEGTWPLAVYCSANALIHTHTHTHTLSFASG